MLIWASLVRPDLQFTGKRSHSTSCSTNRMGLVTSEAHTSAHQGNKLNKFLISPRLPQGHSVPLRQLIPLHINTYCDSDWATDIESRKSTSGTVTSVLGAPLAFNSRIQSTVATSSAEAELYAIGLGISDSLHTYQLFQELQQHLQRQTFDFGNIETKYKLSNSFTTSPSLTTTKSPFHIFTDSTSALSLSNKLGLNKRSKHIALRYLFVQDIQATGLVNIQRVTSRNNRADIYTKCVTSPVLERHLRHNSIIELHIEQGEINYFHILELTEQYFNVTSDEDVEHTKEQQKMKNNSEYTKPQRLRAQQKINKQMKQLFKQKKNNNKKSYIENKLREAAHQADLEHKQSQLLLQHRDLAHQEQREAHLDYIMEEYRNDLGDGYIPFINMIDIHSNEQLPRPRPAKVAEQPTSWLTSCSESNSNNYYIIGHHHHILKEMKEKRGEETSRRRVRSPSPTSAAVEQSSQASETSIVTTTRGRHQPRTSIIVTTLFSLLYFVSLLTSKIDILFPFYIKSASESVHQLYGTSKA